MNENNCKEISDVDEGNGAEEIPNSDDAFATPLGKQEHVLVTKVEECSEDEEELVSDAVDSNGGIIEHNQVFVATSEGLLNAALQPVHQNTEGIDKTTHFVIHDHTLSGDPECGLKEPHTPLPPPTPSTPLSKERGFRYQWDASAFEDVVPVRCKSTSGEMHKSKFGSGIQLGFVCLCILHQSGLTITAGTARC